MITRPAQDLGPGGSNATLPAALAHQIYDTLFDTWLTAEPPSSADLAELMDELPH